MNLIERAIAEIKEAREAESRETRSRTSSMLSEWIKETEEALSTVFPDFPGLTWSISPSLKPYSMAGDFPYSLTVSTSFVVGYQTFYFELYCSCPHWTSPITPHLYYLNPNSEKITGFLCPQSSFRTIESIQNELTPEKIGDALLRAEKEALTEWDLKTIEHMLDELSELDPGHGNREIDLLSTISNKLINHYSDGYFQIGKHLIWLGDPSDFGEMEIHEAIKLLKPTPIAPTMRPLTVHETRHTP